MGLVKAGAPGLQGGEGVSSSAEQVPSDDVAAPSSQILRQLPAGGEGHGAQGRALPC